MPYSNLIRPAKSFIASTLFGLLLLGGFTKLEAQTAKKPNVIFILMDDLGYGDVGVFFQNQRRAAEVAHKPWAMTEWLDSMAADGATLTQYCAAPVCAPSRASLLLGQSQGHANVRDNQFDKALEDNYTLGNMMQLAGYSTAAIGKWGLQGNKKNNDGQWPAHPLRRGFDYYFGYMRHGDGHEHYPKEGVYRGQKEVYENFNEIGDQMDKCYTGDLFTAVAKRYIVEHLKGAEKDKPFFMYLAYDLPHAVLELPTQAYPKGFGLHGGVQWVGQKEHMINTASGKVDSYMDPAYANRTYDDDSSATTAEVPWPDTYKRYATVTHRIDQMVQDVVALLKDLGIDQNTMVVFTSDNGPSKESYLPQQYVPYRPDFFESFGPFDGIKRDVWEGGVRMPTIARWPGHIKPGISIAEPSISFDWMPTFAELAGLRAPVRTDGVSLIPELTGNGQQEKSQLYVEYFHNGKTPDYPVFEPAHRDRKRGQMQMLRLGDTVAIRYNVKGADDDFEFYDIVRDPKQSHNLANDQDLTALQQYVKSKVLQMRMADSSAARPYDDALIPADKPMLNSSKGWSILPYNSSTAWISFPASGKQTTKKVMKLEAPSGAENSALYEGYLEVPADGNYRFRLQTNGKAFLRIHDIALIDEDFHYSGDEKTATLKLAKGYHRIRLYVYFKEPTNGRSLSLQWAEKDGKFADLSPMVFQRH